MKDRNFEENLWASESSKDYRILGDGFFVVAKIFGIKKLFGFEVNSMKQ